jgi:hypothetical protein
MISVTEDQIGACAKSEKILSASPARRLVIEWTTHLPRARRGPAKC